MSIEAISKYRPDIYEVYSFDDSLYNYLSLLNKSEYNKEYFKDRKNEFIKLIKENLVHTLSIDSEVLQNIDLLLDFPINTTDHNGIIQHPEPLNSALLDKVRLKSNGFLSFPGGKIPLNNFTEPFRLNYNGKKIDIFKYFNKRTKNELIMLLDSLDVNYSNIDKYFAESKNIYVRNIIKKIFNNKKDFKTFSEQLTNINNNLFKKLFKTEEDFLFLDKYKFVQLYLINKLKEENNIISDLFNSNSALSELGKLDGSSIFWLNENKKQRKLIYKSNCLYRGEDLIIDLSNKERLIEMLKKNELIINLTLMYMILSFYIGIECLGGIMQIRYLGEIKENWMKILKILSYDGEIEETKKISTKKLIGSLRLSKNRYISDYIFNDESLSINDLIIKSKNIQPKDALNVDGIMYSINNMAK